MQIVKKLTRKLREIRSQKGFTLIEALAGTALLVIVGVAVLVGVSTTYKASAITDKISTALAIAQSQLDFIHTQTYSTDIATKPYMRIDAVERGTDQQNISPYTMMVTVVYIDADGDGTVDGLQKITVEVRQPNNDNPVTLIGYKANPYKDP